jgi:hypothetical protein
MFASPGPRMKREQTQAVTPIEDPFASPRLHHFDRFACQPGGAVGLTAALEKGAGSLARGFGVGFVAGKSNAKCNQATSQLAATSVKTEIDEAR